MIKFCAAKIVQIEQITKFYLSYFEMQPIFDLFQKVKGTIKPAKYKKTKCKHLLTTLFRLNEKNTII
jgi:hypothetical protein